MAQNNPIINPFQKAAAKASRLKLYVYGPTGTGKTVTALHFPGPAVIDTERGTHHYAKFFEFLRIDTSSLEEIHTAVDYLLENPGDVKTLILDSMSDMYDEIVKSRLAFLKAKTRNPNYELQPRDYQGIKSDVKRLLIKILSLDMNIVATARSKDVYSETEFMKKIGIGPEGSKDIPYRFDIVIGLTVDPDTGKRIATVDKDRTNTLPVKFEFNYEAFANTIDIEELKRPAVAFNQRKNLEDNNNRRHKFVLDDNREIVTAGITPDTIVRIKTAVTKGILTQESLKELLNRNFGVESILDLTEEEAQSLVKTDGAKMLKSGGLSEALDI
jgi:hypothetical protein